MKIIFKDYLDIFLKFPKENYLTKEQRKERYTSLQNYEKKNHDEEVSIDEFQNFLEEYKDKILIFPQLIIKFSKVLKEDINNGGLKALKFLIGDGEDNNNYWLQFYPLIYKEFQDNNSYTFIDKILEKEPDYLPALKQKYRLLLSYIDFSVHEIPWGILDGNIVAEEKALPIMLRNLEEFSEISEKLGKDNEKYIKECRIYYNAWADFLGNKDKYKSYEDYLDKNKIEY